MVLRLFICVLWLAGLGDALYFTFALSATLRMRSMPHLSCC
jgi:hypothetical protein